MKTVLAYIFGAMLIIDGLRDVDGRGRLVSIPLFCAAALVMPATFAALVRLTGWDISTRVRVAAVIALIAVYGLPPFIDAARAIYESAREQGERARQRQQEGHTAPDHEGQPKHPE